MNLSGSRFNATHFTQGRIHIMSCRGSRMVIEANTFRQNMVIVARCEVRFGNNLRLENVIIATTDTGAYAISLPQGLIIGRDDGCATGGGAQLLSLGGMNFAADLHMFGGQLLAAGDIEFAANANGIEGASMVAGGQIDGTSNMVMGFCDNGMEDNIEAQYFRLAR